MTANEDNSNCLNHLESCRFYNAGEAPSFKKLIPKCNKGFEDKSLKKEISIFLYIDSTDMDKMKPLIIEK